jgi:hypothetical protein
MGSTTGSYGPYNERTDKEKILSNWAKTCGLYLRGEHSMAVIRAATTVELAANLVVREELENGQNLPSDFVDHLMKWANGLVGKLDKLIIPITKETARGGVFKSVHKAVADINTQRNGVAHRGEYKIKKTSTRIIGEARQVIQTFVQQYDPAFSLKMPDEESGDENP